MIYIVYVVSAGKRTVQDKMLAYRIEKTRSGRQHVSYDEFAERRRNAGDYHYYAKAEPVGYFTSFDAAEKALMNDECGIDEGGSYLYAAIAAMQTDCIYPDACASDDYLKIYMFSDGAYQEIQEETGLTERIRKEFGNILPITEKTNE